MDAHFAPPWSLSTFASRNSERNLAKPQQQHHPPLGTSIVQQEVPLLLECQASYAWRSLEFLEALRCAHRRIPIRSKVEDPKSSERRNVVRDRLKAVLVTLGLAFAFGGIGKVLKILLSALPPDFLERWAKLNEEQQPRIPQSAPKGHPETVIYDCHGEVIATIVPGGYIGKQDPLKTTSSSATLRPADIPSAMWQAVVASEDRRFFEHHGIDPRGISRAVLSLSASGGGSTITQQLVKNVFLTSERKWTRKAVEIVLALLLEKRLSKWEILHLYLSKIYWGHGVYGLKAAAAFYFGKHPSLLTVGECAMLAGIIPAPELLSPFRDPSRGRKAQARTLRRMVETGFLDAATAEAAVHEPLRFAIDIQEGTSGPWRAPYFVSEVLYELTKKYGRDRVLRGGLQVYTTLDLFKQEIAEKAVRDALTEFDAERIVLAERAIIKARKKLEDLQNSRDGEIKKAVTAAVSRAQKNARKRLKTSELGKVMEMIVSIATENAKATVTGRFEWMEKSFRASLAAYEEEAEKATSARMEAAMVAIDPLDGGIRVFVGGRDYYESSFNRCTQAFRPPGSTFKPIVYLTALAEGIDGKHVLVDAPYTIGGFTPENYDHKFRGKVTVEESLLKSLNVPTVKLCAEVGVDKVCSMGAALGIDTYLPYELSLSLGGCEVTPLQLATVYATISSGGVYRKPYFISRVLDSQGKILQEQPAPSQVAVVDEHAVSELRRILQAVVERGTGRGARIGRPCAGKTGTSDGYRDAWFAGFTPELSCVVWLGYDDNTPVGGMHPVTGFSHAAPLWKHFMSLVHQDVPIGRFHDAGRDRYGSKAPRHFQKRSRRPQRCNIQDDVRQEASSPFASFTNERGMHWKEVWDWDKESVAWEEREKMQEWASECGL